MDNKELIGDFPFTVEARVAIQLGRESISSSLVAIGELIKNAYDADAEEVIIQFNDLGTEKASLTITDNGDGMDESTLLAKWMRIGTTNKSASGKSRKERIYTGAKGLGRLGIDRLCSELHLFTKTKENDEILEAVIDWRKYDNPESIDLESIKHQIFKLKAVSLEKQNFPLPPKNQGSQYILLGLKDDWSEEFLIDLQKELSLLVSPFSRKLDFKIKFDTCGAYPELDGYISSEHFLEAAEWQLSAEIQSNNKVKITIYDSEGNISLADPEADWKSWMPGRGESPQCGALNFKLYFMRNIPSSKVETKFKAKDIKNFLKNNQGVRIYRDHFRVKPYGEPSGEGDWLGLAMRRVRNPESITMENWKVGYNQIVGAIFIGREENPNLVDQTNREGLTETTAYYDLRSFSLKSIDLFEKHVQQKEKDKKDSRFSENLNTQIDENVDAYKQILEEIGKIKESSTDLQTKKGLAALHRTLTKETKKTASFREKLDQLEAEKNTLANLASLGIISVSFGHETLAAISTAITSSELLKDRIQSGMFMLPLDTVEFADRRFEQIKKSLNYIKIFGNFALGNVRRDKRSRKSINILSVINNVTSSFDEILEKRKVSLAILTPPETSFFIRAYEIDWESIFANLISNACWALSDTPAERRKIQIKLIAQNGIGTIEFEDSGCGVEPGAESHIFKPTFTTKRNKKGDATGTGMGLSIVKTFIEDHSGGTIRLDKTGELGGAKFIIKVPLLLEINN